MSTCLCFRNYQCLSCEAGIKPRVARSTANRKVAECGTRAGYSRHLKRGEPTCVECKAAQSAAVSKYQREKRLV